MRKLLTATTALALVGGAAFAEITVSGDAEFGIDYNSESKHSFAHDFNVNFAGTGTTDGGLSFGGSAGFDNESGGESSVSEGTVFISGAFGKITFGDNDSADLLSGGIADVGLNGIGVDNVVEDNRGTTENQFRYDNSFGAISIALSAGTKNGTAGTPAKDADRWGFTGLDDRLFEYTSAPTISIIEGVFGIVRSTFGTGDDEEDLPSFDASGTPTSLVGHGYARGADGEILVHEGMKFLLTDANTEKVYRLSEDGDLQSKADADAEDDSFVDAAASDLASEAAAAAFARYLTAYSLGADNAVGGDEDNADMLTVSVMDNSEDAIPGIPSDNQFAFGMSFEASGVTVGVGYDSEKTVSMGLGFSTGDISTNLLYVKTDNDTTGIGGDMSYTMGASTLTLAYAQSRSDAGGTTDAMGINVSHDLGGGANVVAGFGDVNDVSKASVGLSFSF